jgi:hypothetical protein
VIPPARLPCLAGLKWGRVSVEIDMKVLVSAFACTPYAGSENYYGWQAVQCLAKDHDLWVLPAVATGLILTGRWPKGLAIEQFCAQNNSG